MSCRAGWWWRYDPQKNNNHKRHQTFTRALLRQHNVLVVHVEHDGVEKQGLVGYKNGRVSSVGAGHQLITAICDQAHPWKIFQAALCQDQNGQRYIKAHDLAPAGQYKSEQLAGVMVEHHERLLDTVNPRHLIGIGWIASPVGFEIDTPDADTIFDAVGGWPE